MSDVDKSSKTEEPTEKKLSESRSKGQFAKAPEISMTLTLLAGLLVIIFFAPAKAEYLAQFTKGVFEDLDKIRLQQPGAVLILKDAYLTIISVVLPLMICCWIAAFIGEGLQTGFRLTPKAITPSLNKFNPINGVKKIFGIKGLKTFLIDFLKFMAIGTVVWLTILIFLDHPIFYAPIPIEEVLRFIYILIVVLFAILVLLLLIIAVIHYIIKKKENHEELKMTKQEVKDERKSKEIAPEIKSAQRKKAMELLSGQGAQDVSTADVVVTNPTHYAVALRYEKGTDHAPVVVAKGENLLARRIKLIAIEFDVPMVENKPVARSLFALGKVGEAIPLELYRVVAEILANVYKTHSYYFHRLKARRLLAPKQSKMLA